MARRKDHSDPDFGKTQNREGLRRTKRRWGKRRYKLLLGLCVVLLGIILGIPWLVSNRGLVRSAVNRYAGLGPLSVDFQRIEAGWLKPLAIDGVTVRDGQNRLLLELIRIETNKGLLGWLLNSSDLGTIQLRGLETSVVAYDGTTNLEQALAPLLQTPEDAEPQPEAAPSPIVGKIEVVESRVWMSEPSRPVAWKLDIERAAAELKDNALGFGPVELKAQLQELRSETREVVPVNRVPGAADSGSEPSKLADASGSTSSEPPTTGSTAVNSSHAGAILAMLQPNSDSAGLQLKAQVARLPVGFWHVLKARLPELAIDDLRGFVSAEIDGRLIDADRWSFQITSLNASIGEVSPIFVFIIKPRW